MLTDREALEIAAASAGLELYASMLRTHGHLASAEQAMAHADHLAATYARWALGRPTTTVTTL